MNAKDGNGAARPDGVSLLDKVSFLTWVLDTHPVDGGQFKVLYAVVDAILGLEDGKAHNGWCTMGVLATRCRMSKSGVRRALDRLEALGLLKVIPQPGRGGRVYLHVPGVVNAAENLKPRGLKDRTVRKTEANGHGGSNETPAKSSRQREVKGGEKLASAPSKSSRQREVNPLLDPSYRLEPPERVFGGATANPPPREPPALNLEEGERGAFGGEGRALTRPRQHLRNRIVGIANKLGLQDGGEKLLRFATEVAVQDWLRWQREERDQRLVQAIWQALVDEYGLDAEEAGRLFASKAEPKPPPESARPLASEAKPPPPPASSSPSRPPPVVNGGLTPHPALRTVAAAIHEPVLRPPPACRVVYNAEALRASAANLGIPRKGAAS